MASIREPISDREFRLCVHPLQRRRFYLAVIFAIILFPAIAVLMVAGTLLFGLVPLFVLLLWISGHVLFARFLGNSILVSEVNYPRIHAIAEEMKKTLHYQKPVYIFVYEQGSFNAFMMRFFFRRAIFLNSEILNAGVSDDEVRWLIGRFVGYWYARRRFGIFGWLIRVAERFLVFNFFILPYDRAMVYTGDRLAVAAIDGDISSAIAAMQKLLVGRFLGYSVNPEGMVEQHRLVKGSIFAFLARLGSHFPHMTARYVDLIAFAKEVYPAQYAKFEAANPQLPADVAHLARPPSRRRGRSVAIAGGAFAAILLLMIGGAQIIRNLVPGGAFAFMSNDSAEDTDSGSPPDTSNPTSPDNSDTQTEANAQTGSNSQGAPSADDLDDQGATAFDNGDYQAAMTLWKEAADRGNADAEDNIGQLYEEGDGVNQDYGQAMQWYQRAAQDGSASALGDIGDLYKNGSGVERSFATALQWYRKAAAQDDPHAQIEIGLMYENGQAVKADAGAALQWYRKAADQGSATAQYLVGTMYENGKGVARDEDEAVAWYRKAAAQGNSNAKDRLEALGVSDDD
jgi:hypothetical protein